MDNTFPEVQVGESSETQFSLIEKGTERGKTMLTDSKGFIYTIKRKLKKSVDWVCSIRGRHKKCLATVKQQGDHFKPGPRPHNHPPAPGVNVAVKVAKEVKTKASTEVFRPASEIVEEVMLELGDPSMPEASRPKFTNLARRANRLREKTRPKQPADLEFVIDENYIPDGFLRSDIRVDNERHLIFATDRQLGVLATAKTWYIDATFKVVRAPFYQMLSVHAFISSGSEIKQVPLAFALMSRRRTKDYIAVIVIFVIDHCMINEVPYCLSIWLLFSIVFSFNEILFTSIYRYTRPSCVSYPMWTLRQQSGLQPDV
ncbi:hypothetical protein FSP39_017564 [Pinctada imbricata]|uniref:FLYWCH-type domain-containing protein n=1 Tax=Pinctada imbricata TaxID=66713 RepID=A0AA88XRW2_PINIB|nr:hypothetical protein FSP39_017564 [Pinctada imbricata]